MRRDRPGRSPSDPPAVVKVILDSLAYRYASVFQTIETLTGTPIEGVQIIGGGSQNGYLNQATATATGKPVLAGPIEATAIGNAVVQAIAAGRFASLADARAHVARHVSPDVIRAEADRSLGPRSPPLCGHPGPIHGRNHGMSTNVEQAYRLAASATRTAVWTPRRRWRSSGRSRCRCTAGRATTWAGSSSSAANWAAASRPPATTREPPHARRAARRRREGALAHPRDATASTCTRSTASSAARRSTATRSGPSTSRAGSTGRSRSASASTSTRRTSRTRRPPTTSRCRTPTRASARSGSVTASPAARSARRWAGRSASRASPTSGSPTA